MNKLYALALAPVAAVAVAACGSASTSGPPPPAPSSPAATTPAATTPPAAPVASGPTCKTLGKIIRIVAADERRSDAAYQEAWVSGNYGPALHRLIRATAQAGGSNQLGADAGTFNTDANAYLAQNSPYLAPGWQQQYRVVKSDIQALAADCRK